MTQPDARARAAPRPGAVTPVVWRLVFVLVATSSALCSSEADLDPHMPPDWAQRYLQGNLMYGNLSTAARALRPEVGNGNIATVVLSDAVYANNVFNGFHLDDTHRALIPAFHVDVAGSTGDLGPLTSYYSGSRHDHCDCFISDYSVCPSNGGGYGPGSVVGECSATQQPGTVPLHLFWSGEHADNYLSTATSVPGYTRVRVACYVWTGPGTSTSADRATNASRVPLLLYVHDKLHDHWSLTSAADKAAAESLGYTAAGIQGYVRAPQDAAQHGTGMALDVERGVVYRRRKLSNGVLVEDRWFASYRLPSLLVHELVLANPTTAAATVAFTNRSVGFGSDVGFAAVPSALGPTVRAIEGLTAAAETTSSGQVRVAVLNTLAPAAPVPVPAGQNVTVHALTVVVATSAGQDALQQAVADYKAAQGLLGTLYASQVQDWTQRGARGRIEVEGDLELAQAVNASLYFIRASIRPNTSMGLSPGGLASNAYKGHSFWDMETWMWPNLLLFEPESAASCLNYRFDRRAQATANAQSYGRPGMQFPWESAGTGTECCASKGKVMQWGLYEQHISGDIAFAVSQYYHATRDLAWLGRVGFPMLKGIADFWASRAVPNGDGGFSILKVMPPDEFHYPVDDSVYTNMVASRALAFAVEAAGILKLPAGANWTHIAQNLRIADLVEDGHHLEFAKYKGDQVKQADVILLGFPFGQNMTQALRISDLLYYAGRTDEHGPAMTWSMFAVGWLDARNYTMATQLFRRGYSTVQEPFKVWTEVAGGGGAVNFITGAGGFLQSVIFGYGGLRLTGAGLELQCVPLPNNATALTFRSLHLFGARIDYVLRGSHTEVTLVQHGQLGIGLRTTPSGVAKPLAVGATQTLPCPSAASSGSGSLGAIVPLTACTAE